jgi:hypothetical protein
MKNYFFAVLLLFSISSNGQNFEWVETFPYNIQTFAENLVVDKTGDVYTCGNFTDSILIDSLLLINQLNGSSTSYIVKHDSSGNLIWAKAFSTQYFCLIRSMDADSSGNIYATGDFGGQVDFDPDTANEFLLGDTVNTFNKIETFICKLDKNGTFVWAKSFEQQSVPTGSLEVNRGLHLTISPQQDVIVSGIFQDTVDFNPSDSSKLLVSLNNFQNTSIYDSYIAKLSNNGTFKWVKKFRPTPSVFSFKNFLAVDIVGNIYFIEDFYNSYVFDSDTGHVRLDATFKSIFRKSTFLCKLDSSGTFVWASTIESVSDDISFGLTLDDSSNIYCMSRILADPYYNSTKMNVEGNRKGSTLLCKIDPNGTLQSARYIIGPANLGVNSFHLDINNNKIYATGNLPPGETDFYFDSTSTFRIINRPGNISSFTYCTDLNYDSSWVRFYETTGRVFSRAIESDNFGNVYTTGIFTDSVDFNTGRGVNIKVSDSAATSYLHKLSPCTLKKSTKQDTICGADSLVINNIVYTETGNYITSYFSADGCDSLVTTQLFVKPLATDTLTYSLCKGDSIVLNNITYTTQGFFHFRIPLANGCDSIYVIQIDVDPIDTSFQQYKICQGDSISVANKTYFTTGNYLDTLQTANGCDSILSILIEVDSIASSNNVFTICAGDSVAVANSFYSQSGSYIDTLQAINGCDSIVNTNLIVLPKLQLNQSVEICEGDSLQVGLNFYTTIGSFSDTLISNLGCDSIVNTTLTISLRQRTTQNIDLCFGETLDVGTNTYTVAGIYTDTLMDNNGCDSIVTTNLSFKSQIITNQSIALCLPDRFVIGANTYNNSGIYVDTLLSAFGCDSIITTTIQKVDLNVDTNLFNALVSTDQLATYQWLNCNNDFARIDGATNPLFRYNSSGAFALELTFNNCIDTTDCFTRRLEGFDSDVFVVYPNPTKGDFKVRVTNSGELFFYDSRGRLTTKKNCVPGINEFSGFNLSNGIYFLRFVSSSSTKTEKLIITK